MMAVRGCCRGALLAFVALVAFAWVAPCVAQVINTPGVTQQQGSNDPLFPNKFGTCPESFSCLGHNNPECVYDIQCPGVQKCCRDVFRLVCPSAVPLCIHPTDVPQVSAELPPLFGVEQRRQLCPGRGLDIFCGDTEIIYIKEAFYGTKVRPEYGQTIDCPATTNTIFSQSSTCDIDKTAVMRNLCSGRHRCFIQPDRSILFTNTLPAGCQFNNKLDVTFACLPLRDTFRSCPTTAQDLDEDLGYRYLQNQDYPLKVGFGNSGGGQPCKWTITVDSDEFIQVDFLDFDMVQGRQSTCTSQYLSIRTEEADDDDDDEDAVRRGDIYCGGTQPESKTYRDNKLIVNYFSSGAANSLTRGFWLQFKAVPRDGLSQATIAAIVIPIVALLLLLLIILLICFCCTKRKKKTVNKEEKKKKMPPETQVKPISVLEVSQVPRRSSFDSYERNGRQRDSSVSSMQNGRGGERNGKHHVNGHHRHGERYENVPDDYARNGDATQQKAVYAQVSRNGQVHAAPPPPPPTPPSHPDYNYRAQPPPPVVHDTQLNSAPAAAGSNTSHQYAPVTVVHDPPTTTDSTPKSYTPNSDDGYDSSGNRHPPSSRTTTPEEKPGSERTPTPPKDSAGYWYGEAADVRRRPDASTGKLLAPARKHSASSYGSGVAMEENEINEMEA